MVTSWHAGTDRLNKNIYSFLLQKELIANYA